jgi:hypothetical protein
MSQTRLLVLPSNAGLVAMIHDINRILNSEIVEGEQVRRLEKSWIGCWYSLEVISQHVNAGSLLNHTQ